MQSCKNKVIYVVIPNHFCQ